MIGETLLKAKRRRDPRTVELITDFLVKYDKSSHEKRLLVWKSGSSADAVEVDLAQDYSFIIGYQYEGLAGLDGEYVQVSRAGNGIEIKNDHYASYQTYIYEDSRQVIVSSSIREIIRHADTDIFINGARLYDYYAFGYLPATDDTIYKDIRSLRPGSLVRVNRTFAVETNPLELLAITEYEFKKSDLVEYLCESIGRKLKNIPLDNAVFCLTSGHDTLMGILGIKANGYRTDTATWGLSSSDDISGARLRHSLLGGDTDHIEMLIDDVKLTADDFEANADLLGGIGTAASIYLNYFTEKMVSAGKIYQLNCDAYEATRRRWTSPEDIREKYTTPGAVVNKYFLDLENYDRRVKYIIDSIPLYYHHDHLFEFYIYDRCIKGPFYKNAVVRHLGGIKYTLSLDYKFLNVNHAIIAKSPGFTYSYIVEALANKLALDVDSITSLLPAGTSQLPADTPSIIRNNKEYFISILESPYSRELGELWDMTEMKDAISRNTLIEKEEWFVLRLMNLLIFKDKYKIGVR